MNEARADQPGGCSDAQYLDPFTWSMVSLSPRGAVAGSDRRRPGRGLSVAAAREGPVQLNQASPPLAEDVRRFLLLTPPTADQVLLDSRHSTDWVVWAAEPGDSGKVNLMSLYPERPFRYCFTNRQMAAAIMQ